MAVVVEPDSFFPLTPGSYELVVMGMDVCLEATL
jgi:hypothetical protein